MTLRDACETVFCRMRRETQAACCYPPLAKTKSAVSFEPNDRSTHSLGEPLCGKRCEEGAHLIIYVGALGESGRELRFHMLAETLAHSAYGFAQSRGAFAARDSESGECA